MGQILIITVKIYANSGSAFTLSAESSTYGGTINSIDWGINSFDGHKLHCWGGNAENKIRIYQFIPGVSCDLVIEAFSKVMVA